MAALVGDFGAKNAVWDRHRLFALQAFWALVVQGRAARQTKAHATNVSLLR